MNSAQIIDDNYLNLWYDYILKPVINHLYRVYNKYYDFYEDDFYKTILPHDGSKLNFHIYRLREIFPITSYLLPIFNQILIFWSLSWIIFIMFRYICHKKQQSIKKFKATCMVGVKFFVLFIILILLAFTAFATYKIAFRLDSILRNSVHEGCSMINKIRNAKTQFELQLNGVNRSIFHTLLSVENMIYELPENIYIDTYQMVKNDMNNATKSYDEILSKTDFIFDQLGLKITHDKVEQNLEKELNITAKLMNLFNNNIRIIIFNVTEDTSLEEEHKNLILNDVYKIKKYADKFNGQYKFAEWMKVNHILQKTYFEIMPKINISLNFLQKYSGKIENHMKPSQSEVKYIIHNFQNKTNIIVNKLHGIVKQIFHSEAAREFKNIIHLSNNTEYSFNRNMTIGFQNFFISTLVLLIPAIHTMLYIIFMFKCSLVGLYQVYYIYNKKKMTSYIPCFKVVSEVGLMLLWTGLLLSVLCYTGALSLSVLCRPILTERLYTKYIDNHRVWNNKTWLDTVVYPWDHNYTMKNILEKCINNITIYQAFEVEKYWNISMEFRNYRINTDNKEWSTLIKNAVNSVDLPNGQNTIAARDNFNLVEKDLAYCSPHIPYDVELFENETFKILLQNITKKYISTPMYDKLSQNLDVFNYIQNQNLEYLLSNFMEVKYLIKSNQKNLNFIKNAEDQMRLKIRQNMEDLIQYEVYELENSIHTILYNLERDLFYKIQNEIGCCKDYSISKKNTEAMCGELPLILNMAWLIYDINAVLMFMSIILSRNLSSDVSKIRQEYRRNLKREAQERIIQQRQRIMNGTLLFDRTAPLMSNSLDRSGQFMGNSFDRSAPLTPSHN